MSAHQRYLGTIRSRRSPGWRSSTGARTKAVYDGLVETEAIAFVRPAVDQEEQTYPGFDEWLEAVRPAGSRTG